MKRMPIFAALAALALARPAAAEDEVVFALPATNLAFAPVFIADQLGYWKEQGLAVKLPVINGIGAINAALAGSADFAIATGQTVIRANTRGQKAVIVITFFTNLAHEAVLAKPQAEAAGVTFASPIETRARALKGKKIAVNATNAIPHAYLKLLARKGGLDPDRDVQVAVMSPEASFAALKSGAIDGFVQAMPYSLVPIHNGTGVLLSSNLRDPPDFPELVPQIFNGVVARSDECVKKPTVCRRMVAGFERGMAFMHEHPKESIEVLRKKMPDGDGSILEEAYRLMIKWTPRKSEISDEAWAKTQALALEAGMIKPDEKLSSFKELYASEFTK
jgi:ABC-type nitrate/sulfonate/bicarbonate transport system substrate-binding protein